MSSSDLIKNIHKLLEEDVTSEDESVSDDGNEIEISQSQMTPVVLVGLSLVEKLLKTNREGIYMKYLKDFIGYDGMKPISFLFFGIQPIVVLKWFAPLPCDFCETCLDSRDNCCCSQNRAIRMGSIVAELMIILYACLPKEKFVPIREKWEKQVVIHYWTVMKPRLMK